MSCPTCDNEEQNQLRTGFAECSPYNWKRSTWDTCLNGSSNPKTNDFFLSLPTQNDIWIFYKLPMWSWFTSEFENCWSQKWFSALTVCECHPSVLWVITQSMFKHLQSQGFMASPQQPGRLWTARLLDGYCLCWFRNLSSCNFNPFRLVLLLMTNNASCTWQHIGFPALSLHPQVLKTKNLWWHGFS